MDPCVDFHRRRLCACLSVHICLDGGDHGGNKFGIGLRRSCETHRGMLPCFFDGNYSLSVRLAKLTKAFEYVNCSEAMQDGTDADWNEES